MIKYPRTQHLHGSNFQRGDHDMNAVPWSEIADKCLVVEEKVDGAQAGISFEDGKLMLQSRGHHLRGGPRERQFDLFKQWAGVHQEVLFSTLSEQYVLFGEWLYAKHTVFYDALPHYFMEFDVYDRHTNTFLSTPERAKLLAPVKLSSVKVLHEGHVASLGSLADMIATSNFTTSHRPEHLKLAAMASGQTLDLVLSHTDMRPEMEGLYVKWEEDGVVKGRYKFVRETFTNSILEQEEHWHDRPIVQNRLSPGALERMFEP